MRIFIFILILSSLQVQAADEICKLALSSKFDVNKNYRSAVAELARGYIDLEGKSVSGSVAEATLQKIESELDKKYEELAREIGQARLDSALRAHIIRESEAHQERERKNKTVRRTRIDEESEKIRPLIVNYEVESKIVQLTNDRRRFLNVTADLKISMHDFATGTELYKFLLNDNNGYDVKLSPDNRFVAHTSTRQRLTLWDAQTGEQIYSKPVQQNLLKIEFSPDGNTIAAVGGSGKILLINTSDANILQSIGSFAIHSTVLKFSPDGKYLFAGQSTSQTGEPFQAVQIWDVKSGALVKGLTRSQLAKSAFWSSDSRQVFFQSSSIFEIWNFKTENELGVVLELHSSTVSDDGQIFVGTQANVSSTLLKIAPTAAPGKLTEIDIGNIFVRELKLSPDKKKILILSANHALLVWDLETKRMIDKFDGRFENAQWGQDGESIIVNTSSDPYKAYVLDRGSTNEEP